VFKEHLGNNHLQNHFQNSDFSTNKKILLKQLLKSTTFDVGIEGKILQSLYLLLHSEEVANSCKQDCRALVVKITRETGSKAYPVKGITTSTSASSVPLPPVDVPVNITLPKLSIRNEV
jgi:hypothetical protein